MKCRMLSENGIEVELSCEEMQALDITYDALDYANTETRRVLWTVLDEAGTVLGRNIDLSGRMLIEARPDGSGGCILDFTLYPQKKESAQRKKVRKQAQALIFETDDADILLGAVRVLDTQVQGDLYLHDGVFRLLLFPGLSQQMYLTAVLTEFGSVTQADDAVVAATQEFWPLVCENAVTLLRSYALLRTNKDAQS